MIIKEYLIDSTSSQRSLFLKLTTEGGKTTLSEISPLCGYSKETRGQALEQLQGLRSHLLSTWWTQSALHHLENLALYPSVYFGVESALMDLLDPIKSPFSCKTYSLLLGNEKEILEQLQHHTCAKIKLGHLSQESAKRLLDQIPLSVSLRLDFNQKWTLEESLALLSHYPKNRFEYVEEPCSNPMDLIHFSYPFALDETLRTHHDLTPFLKMKNLKALIIKPTLSYPFKHLLNLNLPIVLTSSFEGHVGLEQIKKLSHRLGFHTLPHGLDTLRYHHVLPDCLLETASS